MVKQYERRYRWAFIRVLRKLKEGLEELGINHAEENSAYMYTADEKLLNKVKDKEPLVRHIKNYPRDRIELLGIKT